jgi:hypothetical protein
MTLEEGYTSSRKGPKKPTRFGFLRYAFGIAILLIGGVIAYFASLPVKNFIVQRITTIPNTPEIQIAVGIGIFLMVVMVMALVYSVFQPRIPKGVSEHDLDKEKQARLREELAAKRRKKDMQAKMRQRNQQQNKR